MTAPRALGPVAATGVIRVSPRDFIVDEQLGFDPDGAGEHVLLLVQKVGANSHWVARELAALAEVEPRDVGYAGSKDRHAVVRQWFSVRLAGRASPDWSRLGSQGVEVLREARHGRKLKRGCHRGNAFRITVRRLEGERGALEARLRELAGRGAPNYFGPQRYGRDGNNLAMARELFEGPHRRLPRQQRSFALSAARSFLFDAVLAERVRDGSWNRLGPGDVANLDGSASWFRVGSLDAELSERLVRGDVHPTGPMWGRGALPSEGPIRALELEVVGRHAPLAAGLERERLAQDRRALRMMPRELCWTLGENELALSFSLLRGGFATSVLRELLDYADEIVEPIP